MINYVIKDIFVVTDTLCNYGYIYAHCAAFVIMETHDIYKQQCFYNILKLGMSCEFENVMNMNN